MDLNTIPKTVIGTRGRSFGNRFRVIKGPRVWEFNETAALIWRLCDGTRSVAQILDAVAADYECDRSESDAACRQFLAQLHQDRLIEIEG